MSKKFLSPIKLAQGTTNPATGSAGELFFNTTDVKVYAHNGTTWVPSGGGVTVSATAPSTPIAGDAWYDTVDGTLYVYYNDGDSSQWVEVAANSGISVALEGRLGVVETYVTTLQTETRAVSLGGTGASTLASGGYLKGAGTGAITSQTGIPATDITSGTLNIARGGTGSTTGAGLVPIIPSSISVSSGTASVGADGMVTFANVGTLSVLDVFFSEYRFGKILISMVQNTTSNWQLFRFRTSSGADNSANYAHQQMEVNGTTTPYGNRFFNETNGRLGYSSVNDRNTFIIEVSDAFDSSINTGVAITQKRAQGGGIISAQNAANGAAASHTGFEIVSSSGTVTGTIKFFGYR